MSTLLTSPFSGAILCVGADNTKFRAVAIPTASGNFLRLFVFGWGALVRKASGMALNMLSTPRPPYVLDKTKGGIQSLRGDETMSKLALNTVNFHGSNLTIAEIDGKPFVALKPICDALTLNWVGQLQRAKRNPVLAQGMCITHTPTNSGTQEMVCLPLSMLNGWLFGINANRVKNPAIREKLIQYQFECFDVLNAYWIGKEQPQQISAETFVKGELKVINALVRVNLLTGERGYSYLEEGSIPVNPANEAQVRGFIYELNQSMYPAIMKIITQHYDDVEKAKLMQRRRNLTQGGLV